MKARHHSLSRISTHFPATKRGQPKRDSFLLRAPRYGGQAQARNDSTGPRDAKRPRYRALFTLCALLFCTLAPLCSAESLPVFTTGYEPPVHQHALPRAAWVSWLDLAVLTALLAAASYVALRRRSRFGMVGITLVSVGYLGFLKAGCICPVGSIGNISQGLFDPTFVVPLTVILTFLIPLAFTLFVGRTFCSGVCPIGAMQDLVLVKPLPVPRWLGSALGVIPALYLGVAVMLAAGGSLYIICAYDPVVGFFRLGHTLLLQIAHLVAPAAVANPPALDPYNLSTLLAFGLLLASMVIGRPFCRFLCPYGVLLAGASRVSKRHVTITPDECIKCRLCEDSCPFGAILPASEPHEGPHSAGKGRLVLLLLLVPVMTVACAALGRGVSAALSALADAGKLSPGLLTLADQPPLAGTLLGAWIGLFAGIRLVRFAVRRTREGYEPDRGSCLSCARCFEYCPREHKRLAEQTGHKRLRFRGLLDDPTRAEAIRKSASTTAIIAGVFLVAVTTILTINYQPDQSDNPLQIKETNRLREELMRTEDDSIRAELAAKDRALRSEFFARQACGQRGAMLGFIGLVVLFTSCGISSWFGQARPGVPAAMESGAQSREAALVRWSTALVAALVAGLALFWLLRTTGWSP